jgi:pimeloyl-ACP methyl ester carboxylesterase
MHLLRLVVIASFVLYLGGVAAKAPTHARAAADLQWTECGKGLDCTTIQVPMDYTRPNGRKLDIAVRRQLATNPSKRIGVMLINPGGPGGSGYDFVDYWSYAVDEQIQQRFDIIGFDPRGVGRSTALVCHDTLLPFVGADPTPDNEAEWRQVELAISRFADDCKRADPDLLPHLGTLNVVRDMDQIRAALGEDKISYFGYSYGTSIGAYYADMFPNRVRAMVLDGALDTTLTLEQASLEQAQGFEGALQRYAEDCRRNACALTRHGDPMEVIDGLMQRLEGGDIPAPGKSRPLNEGEYVYALFGSLYGPGSWQRLTDALVLAVESDDASGLVAISDSYLQLQDDGTYPNSTEIYNAVTCLDDASVKDVEYYRKLAPKFEARAPHFGAPFIQAGIICSYWPERAQPLPRPVASGTPPILVVGTTGDPATPYVYAERMANMLKSAGLLTYYGEGHTAYLNDSCIDNAVNQYLLTVVLPPIGAVCGDISHAEVIKIYDSP